MPDLPPDSLNSRLIDERLMDGALDVPQDPGQEVDALSIPATGGVAVFEGRAEGGTGSTLLITTTGDLRELVRRRLSVSTPGDRSLRTDYRAVCARVLVVRCETNLEAEAVYLRLARERLPLAHRTVIERWRAWFVRVDPEAQFPEWGKTNLAGEARARSASSGPKATNREGRGITLGPIRDKDSAGRVIELAIDGFDLCRQQNLLEQAPHAKACAYKEMKRCPAPCDGSETLASYRARVGEAAEALSASGRPRVRQEIEQRMSKAADAHDFELAARCKRALDAMNRMDAPSLAPVEQVERWRLLLVLRARTEHAVQLVTFSGLELRVLGTMRIEHARDAAAQVIAHANTLSERHGACHSGPAREPAAHIDHIAVVSRWLALPAKKRRGEALPLDETLTEAAVARAIARVGKAKAAASAPTDEEEQSVETGGLS